MSEELLNKFYDEFLEHLGAGKFKHAEVVEVKESLYKLVSSDISAHPSIVDIYDLSELKNQLYFNTILLKPVPDSEMEEDFCWSLLTKKDVTGGNHA